MRISGIRQIALLIAVSLIGLGTASCEKTAKAEGKVVVADKQFSVRKFSDTSWTIEARGRVKNVGAVDVKNVVVTGGCKTCGDQWIMGKWFVSPDVEKIDDQKDVIGYLAVGGDEDFNFKDVALIYARGSEPPPMPEGLEITIQSFETVQ